MLDARIVYFNPREYSKTLTIAIVGNRSRIHGTLGWLTPRHPLRLIPQGIFIGGGRVARVGTRSASHVRGGPQS